MPEVGTPRPNGTGNGLMACYPFDFGKC